MDRGPVSARRRSRLGAALALAIASCGGAPADDAQFRTLWARGEPVELVGEKAEREERIEVGPQGAPVELQIVWEVGHDERGCARLGAVKVVRIAGSADTRVDVHAPPPLPGGCTDPRRLEVFDFELRWRHHGFRGAARVTLRADGELRLH